MVVSGREKGKKVKCLGAEDFKTLLFSDFILN